MKLYQIKVTDKRTGQVLLDEQKRSATKKRLQSDTMAKFRFSENAVKIEIERLTRTPGIQTSILDYENED